MDRVRGAGDVLDDRMELDRGDEGIGAETAIGTDERRMHVRAYNHWVSLLHGRLYPTIEDLDPGSIADFGPNSVLLDFTGGIDDPAIRFLGRALREECDVDQGIERISQVPGRSLLSRLTDHYLQIIANRAPIGFEAEFVGTRGHATMYRGILMPFSSDEDTIDFIYGVINWKELVDPSTEAQLHAELEDARLTGPRASAVAPVWADGPSAGIVDTVAEVEPVDPTHTATALPHDGSLGDRLARARETAAAARAADTRSRAALYRALARAYDFYLATHDDPEGYALLLRETGLTAQARAPLTPIAKLVFGVDHDKTRLTEYAAALSHADRNDVPSGGFGAFIDAIEGGLKEAVRRERAARKPVPRPDRNTAIRRRLQEAPAVTPASFGGTEDGFLVLLARTSGDGTVDVVARIDSNEAFLNQAMRRAIVG